jgi:AcrR family transcriptional regulator
MPRKKQRVETRRRSPKQARARETVEVIFDATARILLREGRAALNTNHIAERAGISIGSLYEYFPNKVAILLAMARREIVRATSAVIQAISDPSRDQRADPARLPARLAVRALIAEFTRHRKARHIAFQTLIAEGFGSELETNMDEIARAVVARTDRVLLGRSARIPAVTAFILTRAVNGVLASAANDRSPYLGMIEFEDELVRLIRGFLDGIPVREDAGDGSHSCD